MTRVAPRRVAFLILCHADPRQVRRLVGALDWRADFFIHVDAKADLGSFTTLDWPASTHFVTDRVHVRWGGFSTVEATLRLLRACLAARGNYLRIVLLSGACFPIKPVRQLYELFAANDAIEFIRCADIATAPRQIRDRVTRYWHFDRLDIRARSYRPANVAKIAIRKLMHLLSSPFEKSLEPVTSTGVRLAFGSQWWAVSEACARQILEASDRAEGLRRFLATSLAPDEIYFHTLVAGAPGCRSRLVRYEGGSVAKLANLHLIDPSLTKVFTVDDFAQIARSDRYFVRKVDSRRSAALLDRICDELLGVPLGALHSPAASVAAGELV